MNDFVYMNLIFLLQEINYGYFLIYFLDSKQKKKDFLFIVCIFHFVFNPVGSLLKNQLNLKFLWGLIFLIGLYFYFRKDASIFKIVVSYVILASVMCFGELVLLGILHLLMPQVNQMTMLDLPVWLYICQFFLDFILYTLCIHFLSKSVFVYIKENLFLILLYINQMLILYFSVACLIYYPSSIILCIHIVLIVFQIGILLRVYKQSLKKQKEITCQMLEIEYEKQLNEYIKIRGNQEEYRMLRHDVLNYIQENRR